MINLLDTDYIALITILRDLFTDYEHIGFVKPDVYTRAVEELAKADKILEQRGLK